MTRKPERRQQPPASPEDAALWQNLTRSVKPLHPEKKARRATPKPKPKPEPPPATPTPAAKLPPVTAPALPALRRRRIAGLDQRQADRLRRGELPIDARLDLHGMTQEAAHTALDRALNQAAAQGKRCVLVITGKGQQKRVREEAGFMTEVSGVLRQAVPRWLAEPGLRPLIVATHPAAPQHGGDGALYVLLKRVR